MIGLQEVFDLIAGFSAASGHGHNYDVDVVSGWAAVAPSGRLDGGRQRPSPAHLPSE